MTTIAIPVGSTRFHWMVSWLGYLSVEESTVRSGAGILPGGTIMGRLTATGLWEAYVVGGTYNALGILGEDVDASAAAVKRTIFIRSTEAQKSELTFSGTPTTPQKDAAYALLAAQDIVMR
jgi:hypothetical protein